LHISVLQEAFLSFFRGRSIKTFIDATLGAAGHSLALLQEHPEIELLLGIDQDTSALKLAKEKLSPYENKVKLIHSNFENLSHLVKNEGLEKVDGIFFDLGISSMQIDTDFRGFSFLKEGPLDMRMDTSQDLTAEDIVNSYSQKDLADLFYLLGDEPRSRIAAEAIFQARKKNRITTTLQLVDILSKVLWRQGKIHPATKIFQALRLAVNRELEVISTVLPQAISLLAPQGRLGVISFHSGEDRIVKELFRSEKQKGFIQILTKKPLVPTFEECRANPRSRSAKLRFCEKI